MKRRFSVIPAVYFVLVNEGKVLLSLRKNTGFFDGFYGLVAGHVEGNETMSAAMVREIREEIGLSISEEDLEMRYVSHRKSDDRESVDFFFYCSKIIRGIVNKEPLKCQELRFFPLDSLPKKIIPFVKVALCELEQHKTYNEYGWL